MIASRSCWQIINDFHRHLPIHELREPVKNPWRWLLFAVLFITKVNCGDKSFQQPCYILWTKVSPNTNLHAMWREFVSSGPLTTPFNFIFLFFLSISLLGILFRPPLKNICFLCFYIGCGGHVVALSTIYIPKRPFYLPIYRIVFLVEQLAASPKPFVTYS